ncbi:Ca-activated chloride channel family protein [Winogradskyella wandonensis]|uniref:Ca-activated chloride channel family protein n=1 Tax=Winogradskyella wandonensis TaxID=1442586 RepID=A0A4R1KV38_9FLAO|nr:VWA domain-containing protein [Winogradskyella wandonensis]TCK69042.1 Ca-activated chloride channel family protein [Winogradskyella wandonensis]
MKNLLQLFTILIVALQLQAQQITVSGIVTAASDGLPLPGVNVIVKGTANGTQTDFDGKYTINAIVGDQLVFSFVSMKTSTRTIGKNPIINVAMEEDSAALDEVVITGYSTGRNYSPPSKAQLKRRAQKAYHNKIASQINGNSISRALQGQVTGVNVNTGSGQPGQTSQIIIRGSASLSGNREPLYIIDGVPVNANKVKHLNPDNIKSVSVLKDASATSIYGSRASNGAIVISTNGTKVKNANKLYIIDGVPVKKEDNYIAENLPKTQIDTKIEYSKAEAKRKFGKVAKEGCIVITTKQGNFRIQSNETYAVIEENSFERTTLSPLSTFSIDVDKASYSNVRRMINSGESIQPDAVKIEEMVNYFNYDYPQPTDEHPFSINTEVVKTPWHTDTQLVRIGLQGKTYKNEELPLSNLTFLIDVSGSMGSPNKLPLLKSAFKLLVNQLRKEDKVSIVVYAGAAGVVLEPTSGDKKAKIIAALDNLNSGGSTAGGAGINLAYKLAEKNFKENGNNRVILATDGDFNVGESSDKAMEKLIEEKRKSGVFLSVLGFGYGNYKDSKLETLADKGNGNHAYIDTMQEANKVFGKEFGGTLYTIAKDVKIQVEFNPNKVQAYRLIGYENRLLNDEDFVDDTKDAGELGSGHTVTALYEVVPTGIETKYLNNVADLKYTENKVSDNYNDELFTVKFRYKKPDENQSIEMVHVQNTNIVQASEDMNFASAVALFGMQLRQSQYFNNASVEKVLELAESGRGEDKDGYRAEFIRLVKSSNTTY